MTGKPKTWRDVLPVHPAAELFPMMSEAELRELGKDIEANDLTAPILLWSPDPKAYDNYKLRRKPENIYLLDGRNRLAAMEASGITVVDKYGRLNIPPTINLSNPVQILAGDPYQIAASANIHRRHLTAEQRRDLIAKALKAKPEASNLQIAKQVKRDDKTVAKVRRELEARSEIPNVDTRTDTKGRQQPAKRKPAPRAVFDSPKAAHSKAGKPAIAVADKEAGRILDHSIGSLVSVVDILLGKLERQEINTDNITPYEWRRGLKLIDQVEADLRALRANIEQRLASLKPIEAKAGA
jgi:hypothetical protein